MNWPMLPLGELTSKIGSGATPRGGSSVYVREGALLIRSQNVLDNRLSLDGVARISDAASRALAGATVETGDVLINITGDSIARVALVKHDIGDARVNQHVAIVRPNGLVEAGFVQKYLASPEAKARLLSLSQGGATRKALTKGDLSQFLLPVPPLPAQQAIADFLGALDDKIAANRRVAEAHSALAITMVAQQSRTLARVPLSDIASLTKSTIAPQGIPGVAHFSLPAFDADLLPVMEAGNSIKSNKQRLAEPSVLLSKLNPRIPRVWDVPVLPSDVPAVVSTEFLVLEPHGVCTTVLWATLMQPESLGRMKEMARGTSGSHQRVAPSDALEMPVPDIGRVGARQVEAIRCMGQSGWQLKLESRHIAHVRDTLLPHLMSGRITVRQAQALAEEVV